MDCICCFRARNSDKEVVGLDITVDEGLLVDGLNACHLHHGQSLAMKALRGGVVVPLPTSALSHEHARAVEVGKGVLAVAYALCGASPSAWR